VATLSVDQVLLRAKSYVKKGKIEEAQKLYQTVLQAFPKNKRAQQGLAALSGTKQTIDVPGPPQEAINQWVNLYNQGQMAAALAKAQALTEQYPKAFFVWNLLGAAHKGLGETVEASAAFLKVTELNPNYADGFSNLSVTLQEQGKLDEAIEACKKALVLKPDYTEAYYNLANALKEQGKLDEAIGAYNKTLAIKPDYAEAYQNMGIALQNQDKFDKAIEAYTKALTLKPDYTEAYNNMGNALKDQGKLDEAIEAYTKALAFKPDYTEAWSNGAEALEKWNKLERLKLWLDRAFQAFETVPADIKFIKAKLLWRNREFQASSNLMCDIDFEKITEIRAQDYLNLKAKCYEKYEDFDKAYECFLKSNLLAKKSNDYLKCQPETYFQNLRETLTQLQTRPFQTPINYSEKEEEESFIPVFLVGFPRSGTTLLDTILRSHSKIEVVEEQPTLKAAEALLRSIGYSDLANNIVPPKLLTDARKTYEAEFYQHIGGYTPGSVYIDKLPLNLLRVPLIHLLYPQAKFIMALRHPMDTILSCWMQNFKLNPAMANMVDLERVAEFYCVAMKLFKIYRAQYNLSVHQIRYEDLLEGISEEISALLNFLDLDWETQMESYQVTALKRGSISTPSYSQVVQPIYKDAKFRWLNYEKYLDEYIEQVKPWVNEFRYGDH